MIKQVLRLSRLQLGNLFGINVILHTNDRKKRAKYVGLSFVWIMLIAMVMGYVAMFCYSMASMGMSEIIPMYLYALASILILVFSFFKVGNTLFAMRGYEMLISLPVKRSSIIISRFLSMYFMNFLMELIILLPGFAVYCIFSAPGIEFYIVYLLGTLFLPLLPLTVSSILGAIITAVSSRSRHKSIVETVLMLALVIAVMGGSLFLSDNESQLTEEMMKNLAALLSEQIGGLYPPSIWFQNALSGNIVDLGLLLGVPTVIFAAFVAVLQKYFQAICAGIHAVSAKNNYKMGKMQRSSHLKALWQKELKRYVSSSVYVTNTIIGYVMAVLLCGAILFMGIEQIASAMGVPEEMESIIITCLPFVLSVVLCMTSITACSISLEGNTFWQIQSLPVSAKEFYDSKIVTQLSITLPFYAVSIILLSVAVKPDFISLIWLILIPFCYILFSSVAGVTVNLMFPVLKWENEVNVVKQSASMMIAMLIGVISSIIPIFVMIFAGSDIANPVCLVTVLILIVVTTVLYRKNLKKELFTIGER